MNALSRKRGWFGEIKGIESNKIDRSIVERGGEINLYAGGIRTSLRKRRTQNGAATVHSDGVR